MLLIVPRFVIYSVWVGASCRDTARGNAMRPVQGPRAAPGRHAPGAGPRGAGPSAFW
jgi:hypothetical protein